MQAIVIRLALIVAFYCVATVVFAADEFTSYRDGLALLDIAKQEQEKAETRVNDIEKNLQAYGLNEAKLI